MKKIFSIGRFVISIAWAKSLTWAVTTEKESRTMFLAFNGISRGDLKAIEILLGPIALIIGKV